MTLRTSIYPNVYIKMPGLRPKLFTRVRPLPFIFCDAQWCRFSSTAPAVNQFQYLHWPLSPVRFNALISHLGSEADLPGPLSPHDEIEQLPSALPRGTRHRRCSGSSGDIDTPCIPQHSICTAFSHILTSSPRHGLASSPRHVTAVPRVQLFT